MYFKNIVLFSIFDFKNLMREFSKLIFGFVMFRTDVLHCNPERFCVSQKKRTDAQDRRVKTEKMDRQIVRSEPENDFFVNEFPDAVKQRITHGMIAAADP